MARLLKNAAKDIADAFTRWNLWQGGSASALSDLNDVSINNPQADEVLQFNGSDWVNAIVQGGGSLGGKVETLWTNPSPLSIFEPQTISMDTNYDLFIVHFRPTNTSGTNFTLCLNRVLNRTYYLLCNSGDSQDYQLMRAITLLDNSVQFGGALRPGIEFGNQYCVPTMIVGIKFAEIDPNLHEYSTEERVIGKWIDGKPLYERVVEIPNFEIPSHTWVVLPNFPQNIKYVVDFKAFEKNDGVWWALSVGKGGDCYSFRSNGAVTINTYIVQYTKTTD